MASEIDFFFFSFPPPSLSLHARDVCVLAATRGGGGTLGCFLSHGAKGKVRWQGSTCASLHMPGTTAASLCMHSDVCLAWLPWFPAVLLCCRCIRVLVARGTVFPPRGRCYCYIRVAAARYPDTGREGRVYCRVMQHFMVVFQWWYSACSRSFPLLP